MKAAARAALLGAALVVASCGFGPNHPSADLVVKPDGALFLNGNPVAEKDLVAALKAAYGQQPDFMLYIRTDGEAKSLPPNIDLVHKAVAASGIPSGESTQYKEQVRARKIKSLLYDALFIGALVLPAMAIGMFFALRAATPSEARRRGFGAVVIAGLVIAVGVGIIYDTVNYKRLRGGGGAWGFGMIIAVGYTAPWTLLAGLLAGPVSSRIVRRRLAKAASPGS